MDADDRTFVHDLLRRHERASDADASLEQTLRRLDAEAERIRDHTREMREDHREFVEKLRAQRTALFRIRDRLDEGGAGAGA